MKSAFWRATALLMALGMIMPVAVSAGSQAGEVSHSAMMGSTLMNTSAQLNTWTHWAVNYGNYTELNTEALNGGSAGPRGTFIWDYDGENTLLFRVRDMDLGSQNSNFMWSGMAPLLSSYASSSEIGGSGFNALQMGQLFNVAWARELSGGGAFSIGAFYGDHSTTDDASDPSTEDGSSAYGLQASWGNGDGFDAAGSFTGVSLTNDDGANELEGSVMNFDAYGRFQQNDWIYQAGFFFASGTFDEFDGTNVVENDGSAFGVIGNVGQILRDETDGSVTAEFYAAFMQEKDEPADDSEDKTTDLVVPGLRVACEQKVSDHFGIMLGSDAYYTFSSDEVTDSAGDTVVDSGTNSMTFDWNGGIFWENADGFRVAGEFGTARSNLDKAFSLGNDSPLVYRLEATYGF